MKIKLDSKKEIVLMLDAMMGIVIMLLLLLNLGLMVAGIADYNLQPNRCNHSTFKKYEIIMPAHRLGCWLGGDL
jgi:hypothetical protein